MAHVVFELFPLAAEHHDEVILEEHPGGEAHGCRGAKGFRHRLTGQGSASPETVFLMRQGKCLVAENNRLERFDCFRGLTTGHARAHS
jgi:hypothetical protein